VLLSLAPTFPSSASSLQSFIQPRWFEELVAIYYFTHPSKNTLPREIWEGPKDQSYAAPDELLGLDVRVAMFGARRNVTAKTSDGRVPDVSGS
jgi:hypothetical protein